MNIFDYNSKFNQMLMTVADLIILNLLYVIFSIPLFTIGAAQAGLFTGIRVMLDKEDDSSCAKAFFRGFRDGFKTITGAHLLLSVLLAIFCWLLMITHNLYASNEGTLLPVIVCGAGLLFIYMAHSVCGPFHATFGCTTGQLVRNSLMMAFAYPLRSLLNALLVVLPLAVFLLFTNIFMRASLGILAIYYSTAYLLCFTLLKKPFQRLKDSFYAAHNTENQRSEDEPESEATDQSENANTNE